MTDRPRILFSVVIAVGVALMLWLTMVSFDAYAQEPTRNDTIQDQAVVVDQKRQDRADAAQDVRIAANSPTNNVTEDNAQNVVTKADNAVQNAKTIANSTKIQEIKEQGITDRQFMAMLALIMVLIVGAVWAMLYQTTSRLWKAANMMIDRTELLEEHIAITTPEVIEAHRARQKKGA